MPVRARLAFEKVFGTLRDTDGAFEAWVLAVLSVRYYQLGCKLVSKSTLDHIKADWRLRPRPVNPPPLDLRRLPYPHLPPFNPFAFRRDVHAFLALVFFGTILAIGLILRFPPP